MNTRRRLVLATAAVLAMVTAGSAAWLQWRMAQPLQLTLRFHATVGAQPLVFNEARYANPGGDGHFAVRDVRLFISNLRLLSDAGVYVEPDSYHLLRFDGPEPVFVVHLHDVPRRDYTRIEFGIGVDPAANGSIAVHGDLDPNGRMAWTWDVGYKFVLFEGTLENDGKRRLLVYHVGFDENYTPLAFALDGAQIATREPRLDFRVDVQKLFTGSTPIDMAALPNVKFDHEDAAALARNYAAMITPL